MPTAEGVVAFTADHTRIEMKHLYPLFELAEKATSNSSSA
jgi:hypothetical protein